MIGCGLVRGAIAITSVSNETVYTDSASFSVESLAGFSYVATLNGESVPVGVSVQIDEARFYELEVTKTELLSTQKMVEQLKAEIEKLKADKEEKKEDDKK